MDMQPLTYPEYAFNIKQNNDDHLIFDFIRKKFVLLTPEEWVRQHVTRYLVEEKHYPLSRLAVEYSLKYNNLHRRADVVFFGKYGDPLVIVECKAPEVKVDQVVFDQAVRYNYVLKVKYIMVTNGIKTFCCFVDYNRQKCNFLERIPEYAVIEAD